MSDTSSMAARLSSQKSGKGWRWVDPKTLMAIKNLELRARAVMEGFLSGLHRSPYHGFSVEFTEYRSYVPGDDLRYMDWKLMARSDRYYIKKFEDETNLRCFLVSDNSRSMSFGSVGYSKLEYANTFAGTLAHFLYSQGDATGVMTFDDKIREYLPARHRPGHLRHLMLALEKTWEGRGTDIEAPLRRLAELLSKRSLVVLFSDMLAPVDKLGVLLGALAARGHEVMVFQVLDPEEVDLDWKRPVVLEDMESGKTLYVDPSAAREAYQKRFGAHQEAVKEMCSGMGIGYRLVRTDQPLELALFDFLQEREHLRGVVVRRNSNSA